MATTTKEATKTTQTQRPQRPTSLHHDHNPPPPPIFSTSTSSCHLHPNIPFTGFCSSCLRDRLSLLPSTSTNPLLRRSKSSSAHTFSLSLPHGKSCETIPDLNPHPQSRPHPDPLPTKSPPRDLWLAASALARKLKSWRKKQEKPQCLSLYVTTFDSHNAEAPPVHANPERHHLCNVSPHPSDTHIAKASNLLGRASKKKQKKKRTHLCSVADYHRMGRRPCAVEQRFSLDLPRFSWDGMIHVEGEEEGFSPQPGGALQTREYYGEGPRRSVERSRRSVERSRGSLMVELDEGEEEGCSNSNFTPSIGDERLHSNGKSQAREFSPSVGNGSFCNGANSQMEALDSNPSRPWTWKESWSRRGLLQQREDCDDGELSKMQSWRMKGSGGRMLRSKSSSVSSRHLIDGIGGMWSNNGLKKGEDLVLEQSSHLEESNGFLKFHFKPIHGNRRGGGLRLSGSRSSSREFLGFH